MDENTANLEICSATEMELLDCIDFLWGEISRDAIWERWQKEHPAALAAYEAHVKEWYGD